MEFQSIVLYEKHLLSIHKDTKLLQSDLCFKSFKKFRSLANHKKQHNETTYQCKYHGCDFKTGVYRSIGASRKCNLCCNQFTCHKEWHAHIKTHENGETGFLKAFKVKSQYDKQLSCEESKVKRKLK